MKAIETIVVMFFVMVVMTVIHGQSPSVKASVASGAGREQPLAVLSDKIIVKRYYLRKT